MLKKLSINIKLIIMLSTAVLVSIFSFWLFSEAEFNKDNISYTKNILSRNNTLLYKILLSSDQMYENEEKSRKEIADAVFVYDYYIYVIKDGGTTLDDDGKRELPSLETDVKSKVEDIEKQWYNFKAITDKILAEQLYIYIKNTEDTLINGVKTEITKTKRVVNKKISQHINNLNSNIGALSESNRNLINLLSNRVKYYESENRIILILSIIIYLLIFIYLLLLFRRLIIKSLYSLNHKIKEVLTSKKQYKLTHTLSKEFQDVNNSINQVYDKFDDVSTFLDSLGNDNFEIRLKKYEKSNSVDKGLIALRDKLKDNAEKETKRQEKEKLRQWTIEGQAKFNEILRHSANNVDDLSDSIISNLVTFLNAAQGGLFLLNNKDKSNVFIELQSAFAYDRKKVIIKNIALGEGFIGTCALEKNTIWINNIPSDYMEIESGLGESPPKSLLIVPLKTESDLLGIIEIASFFEITKLQVEFVESIAHNIASSLQTSKISERTAELLKESQIKSEELAFQDTEMRNRIEELKKAQDEAEKRDLEFSILTNAVNNALIKTEISRRGKILSSNVLMSNVTDYHIEELHGMSFVDIVDNKQQNEVDAVIKKSLKGETIKLTLKIRTKHDKEVWLLAQFTPTLGKDGKVSEVLVLANDITKQKETEEKNRQLLEDTIEKAQKLAEKEEIVSNNYRNLKKSQDLLLNKEYEEKALFAAIDMNLIKAEYDIQGNTIDANLMFSEIFKYNDDELQSMNVRDFISKEYLFDFENVWEKLLQGDNYNGTVKLYDKNEGVIWLVVSFSPVADQDDNITKILFIANDITNQKNIEEKIKKQAKELKDQEELMTQNMTEALLYQEEIENEIEKLQAREDKIKEKFEKTNDKKYFDWLNGL